MYINQCEQNDMDQILRASQLFLQFDFLALAARMREGGNMAVVGGAV